MRNNLIRLAIQYEGEYSKIKQAIQNNEIADESIILQDAITILDESYPTTLKTIKYPPFVLFYEGNLDYLKERKYSIVGTRQPSEYGIYFTLKILEKIDPQIVIVSGLAKGIDAIGHQNAKKSIGILGNGLDVVYPKENKKLYQEMKNNQLLLSEYPLGVKPIKRHFPFRNRIIAGLSEKLIVTEARLGSGSLYTAKQALQNNKKIYTIDYQNESYQYQGLQFLLSKGAIALKKDNIDTLLK